MACDMGHGTTTNLMYAENKHITAEDSNGVYKSERYSTAIGKFVKYTCKPDTNA